MSKKSQTPPPPQPVFETSLRELEDAVDKLEAGELSLEESLQLFEKGVASLKTCHAILNQAEKRIRVLMKGSNGTPELREAELREAGEEESKSAQPKGIQKAPEDSDTKDESEDAEQGLW